MRLSGVLARYGSFIDLPGSGPVVSLHEGDTPLIAAPRLAREIGLDGELYLKYEGTNPTGSFKDRGMAVAVTAAVMEGARAVICASTGNTSAAAAAYAARAGIPCFVLIPEGNVATGKLSQTLMLGARVIEVQGNFDVALELVRQVSDSERFVAVNSINPYRLQGQKTAAFEICDDLDDGPDYLALPVGNAGNISAYWMGFQEYKEAGRSSKLPKMLGFEAAGAAPLTLGRPVDDPETVATAIRIGKPASWDLAVAAQEQSGGRIDMVTDDEILDAYTLVARTEGVFCEPASAASIAGVAKMARQGMFRPGERIVCVLTGNGLKDPDMATRRGGDSVVVPARKDALLEVLER